jgi:hypothetical protein
MEDNIKINLRESVDWIRLTRATLEWRAVVNTEMNFRYA